MKSWYYVLDFHVTLLAKFSRVNVAADWCCPMSTSAGVRNFLALLIGVGEYTHPQIPDLPVTVHDVRALAGVLTDAALCEYPAENVSVLAGEHATLDNIRHSLRDLVRKSALGKTVFIYFSGHGARLPNNGTWRAYLLPRGADPQQLDRSALSGEELSEAVKAIKANRVLVIVDACHAAGAAQIKAAVGPVDMKVGLPDSLYLALSQGEGRVIMASSKLDQVSLVRPQGDLSMFTYFLLQALRGGAATPGDGFVRVLHVYDFVSEAMRKLQLQQEPILKVDDLNMNFPIAYHRTAPEAAAREATAPEIASIREHIVYNPRNGARLLLLYLPTLPPDVLKRAGVDVALAQLKYSLLIELEERMDRFGRESTSQAQRQEVVFWLIKACQDVEHALHGAN